MYSPVRHLGTEHAAEVLAAMRAELEEKIEIVTKTAVAEIVTDGVEPACEAQRSRAPDG